MSESDTVYEFGPFRLEGALQRLSLGRKKIKLSNPAFELLRVFAMRRGYKFTKEELIHQLWPRQDVFSKSGHLYKIVSELRKALSDEDELYIKTLPPDGYMFVGTVREVSGNADEEKPDAEGEGTHSPAARNQLDESDPAPVRELFERISRIPDLLPEGAGSISWLIVNAIVEGWEENLREVTSKGMVLPRLALQDCVVKLFEAAKGMTVIDARCYDPREEWNPYWTDWLRSTRGLPDVKTKEYYMLYTGRLKDQEAKNLIATKEIMDEADFDFYVCNKKYLVDYFSPRLPYFDALNIFGDLVLRKKILKSKDPEMSIFSGGHPLRFWLHDKRKQKLYAQIHRVVRFNRKEVSQDLIDSLREQP